MTLTLVVLAAGRATRFGRLKQLEPIGPFGAALMDYGIYDAWKAGVRRVVLIVPPGEEARFEEHVRGHFGTPLDVAFVPQTLEPLPGGFIVPPDRTKPWGTAHAVLAAERAVHGPFLVANADDHYGRVAYRLVADWLHSVPPEAARFAVVGYRLSETLSAFGGVSRAVCHTDHVHGLVGIEEILQVARAPDGALRGKTVGGEPVSLRGDELVSMNLWGFTARVFPMLRSRFADFLRERGEDATAEYLIPAAAMDQVRAGEASYGVLPTTADWFGLTFPDDAEAVRQRIADAHARGEYPDRLGEGIA